MNQHTAADIIERLDKIESHLCGLTKIANQQSRIIKLLKELKQMNAETTAILGRLDAATNAIAAKLQALIDKASQAGSVTEAEVRAALEPEVAKLEGLAADPADPVPA